MDLLELSDLPFLFLCGLHFLSSVWGLHYKLRGGAWLTQSDSGGLKSPQLLPVLSVLCGNTQCGTPTKEPVMSSRPVPLWGHTGRLCSSVCLRRGFASAPPGVWLNDFSSQGGKRCSPWASHLQGKWVLCVSPGTHRLFSHFKNCFPPYWELWAWGFSRQTEVGYKPCPYGKCIVMKKAC